MAAIDRKRNSSRARFVGHVALSVVFFSIVAIIFWFFHPESLPYFGSNIFYAVFFAFGMISFLGGALFLYVTIGDGREWNFRLPLVCLAAVVTLSSFLTPALQTRGVLALFPGLGLAMAMVWSYAVVLLVPAAVFFFASLRPFERRNMGTFEVLSIGVSLLSAYLILGLLLQTGGPMHPYPDESWYGLMFWVYLIFGMPLVGGLVLASSAERDSAKVSTGQEEKAYENP
jgi:MFS family permease